MARVEINPDKPRFKAIKRRKSERTKPGGRKPRKAYRGQGRP
jgi:hypothetical protein